MNIAIIMGGGKGKRMSKNFNKHYLPLGKKPIICHSLDVFEASKLIEKIKVVLPSDEIPYFKKKILNKNNFKKIEIAIANQTRHLSSFEQIMVLNDDGIVLIHDSARPFITHELIEDLIENTEKYGAAIPVVPIKETVKVIENNFVRKTTDRSKLFFARTPQCFKIKLIRNSYQNADENPSLTDNSIVAELNNIKVKAVVEDNYDNIKITTPEDYELAKQIWRRRVCE